MKKFTIPLFAALIGFTGFANAETITSNTTPIDKPGQTYSKVVDLSSFGVLSNVTMKLTAAGDYNHDNEIFTFKIDEFIIAEWTATNAPTAIQNEDDYTFNYFTLSGNFNELTEIGTSTFGEIWKAAALDGYVTFSWYNTSEVEDMTNGHGLDDFVQYSVSAVPEPSTYALMLAGLGLVGFMAKRRRKA